MSLQVRAADPAGNPLTFSAEGLPPGLRIDANSGLISGTVSPLATKAAASYTTTVAVHDGDGNTAKQTFHWAVSHANPAPWLSNPLLQVDQVGDAVSLQVQAGAYDGGALTFTAAGLPAGLSINATTGRIMGVIAQAGVYAASVSVTDGTATTTRQFSWDVFAGATPQVMIAINGTTDRTDDVALVGAAPIPVVVTLRHAGLHEVDLRMPGTGADRAGLSQTVLWLADGGTATVWLTALQASVAEDDVQLLAFVDGNNQAAGAGALTDEKLTFLGGTRVTYKDTPQGMADRIPPHVDVIDPFTLSVALDEGQQIDFKVDNGGNDANGRVRFIDATDHLTDVVHVGEGLVGARVDLYGTVDPTTGKAQQTEPGHAGNLYLVAFVHGNPASIYKSDGFSVAAIPIAVAADHPKLLKGTDVSHPDDPNYRIAWGVRYQLPLVSDSGNPDDLDGVKFSEVIKKEPGGTGYADTIVPLTSEGDYMFATLASWDDNAVAKSAPKILDGVDVPLATARPLAAQVIQQKMDKDGPKASSNVKVQQYFLFKDSRTAPPGGATPFVTANSGFEISFNFYKDQGKYFVHVQRTGAANNGAEKGEVSDADGNQPAVEIK